MPLYDRVCDGCDWEKDDCYEPRDFAHACPSCGQPTRRLIGLPIVIGDEYTVPLVDDAMSRTTQVFRTKSEHLAAAKKHGVRIMERGDGHGHRFVSASADREARVVNWHKHQRGAM